MFNCGSFCVASQRKKKRKWIEELKEDERERSTSLWRKKLTLILLFTTTPTFANSVDPDQKPSNQDLHCLSFSLWIWMKTLYDVIWLADSQKWVWLIKLFSRIRVNNDAETEEIQICRNPPPAAWTDPFYHPTTHILYRYIPFILHENILTDRPACANSVNKDQAVYHSKTYATSHYNALYSDFIKISLPFQKCTEKRANGHKTKSSAPVPVSQANSLEFSVHLDCLPNIQTL